MTTVHSQGSQVYNSPWKTPTENHADKLIHGTHSRGERQGAHKLTERDVRDIRGLKGTMLQREIAARFGVSRSTVADIFLLKTWWWLDAQASASHRRRGISS